MISTYRKFMHGKKILGNPDAVATVERIYYQYTRPNKQRFLAKLKGIHKHEESVLKDMTLEDSREFQKALSRLTMNHYRVCRLGRGPRAKHGVRSYSSYLPLDLAERVSIYIYPRYGRWTTSQA